MTVVAVAGGLGDMGRLIVDALVSRGKYEVYVLSRRAVNGAPQRVSPISGKEYNPVIQVDYDSESDLMRVLSQFNVHTIVSVLALDFQEAADAQVRLIRAADQAPSVKRFIPSEFNVDYDQGDDVLPYPEKRFHTVARRALEQTGLEFAYIHNGMFMDYYAMPNIDTHLRPLYSIVDASKGVAAIPGDGTRKVAMTYTKDVARYTALVLEIEQWPRVLNIMASEVTLNELIHMIEQNLGRKLNTVYDPIEQLLQHDATVLPSNEPYLHHFPGGRDQVKALLADLGASMALGAYEMSSKDGLDVIKYFEGKTEPPQRLEGLLEAAWKGQ